MGFSSNRRGITNAVSVGSGSVLVKDTEGNVLELRTLVAGPNITLNTTTDTIEITSSGGGGGSTPGDPNQSVQYNNGGTLAGTSSFIYDNTTNEVTMPKAHISGNLNLSGSLIPVQDTGYDLGSLTQRWSNIYTGDLHLKNERGDWTIFEEADKLIVRNNLTGETFKMMLEKWENQ